MAPFGVAASIGAAYWFTSSTSFANPTVTIARVFSNTFAGIAPGSVLPFILAQLVAAGLAVKADAPVIARATAGVSLVGAAQGES